MSDFPKITFGIIVFNGEPFTRYCLRAIYPFAHEIIVVEGAVKSAASLATPDGHSTDGTLDTLYRFKEEEDPENKLQIVIRNGFWEEKDEQSRAYAERATGDYLWQVDIDEFYKPQDIQTIITMLAHDPSISGVSFHWKNFWGGFDYLVDGWEYRNLVKKMKGIRRIFRWGKDYQYISHRPPTIIDAQGRDLCTLNWIGPDETAKMGVFCYHYGMVFPKQAKQKTTYYQKMWQSHKDMPHWYHESYLKLRRPLRILHGTKPPSWLRRFKGTHPPVIRKLIEDCKKGMTTVEERWTEDIEQLLNSRNYQILTSFLSLSYYMIVPFRDLFYRIKTSMRRLKKNVTKTGRAIRRVLLSPLEAWGTMMLSKLLRMPKAIVKRALGWLTSPQAAILFGEPFFYLTRMRQKNERAFHQVKRALVVRLDEIGDVVMTTPFLRELRRNLPDAWITLIVKPTVYNLVELCPYVNEVLTYDWNTPGRFWQLRRHGRALRLAWKHLWQHGYDLAILPRWDADHYHGTFLIYFSSASWRVGYSEKVNALKKHINRGFDCLLTHPLNDSNLKHEVEHNLDVICYLGGYVQDDRLELWLSEEDETFAKRFLSKHEVKHDDLLIALAPGGGAPKRLWPVDRFAEVGSWLQNTYEAQLLVVGGPGEEPLGKELEQALGRAVVNAVGRTTLRQTAALLKCCRLFVGNDAGPMHMAAALGVPVVELSCHPRSGSPWSANSPLRFGPWGVDHVVLQPLTSRPPCVDECVADHPHCILEITVEQVKEAVAEQLRQSQAR